MKTIVFTECTSHWKIISKSVNAISGKQMKVKPLTLLNRQICAKWRIENVLITLFIILLIRLFSVLLVLLFEDVAFAMQG